MKPCNLLHPCLNMGNCTVNNNKNDSVGYSYLCKDGFIENECQTNLKLCQDKTCLNNGKRFSLI